MKRSVDIRVMGLQILTIDARGICVDKRKDIDLLFIFHAIH